MSLIGTYGTGSDPLCCEVFLPPSTHSCYRQLSVSNKPLVWSTDSKWIWKVIFSSADMHFSLPRVFFNPAWFLTQACEKILSSLQVIPWVNGSHQSSHDLMHQIKPATQSTTDLPHRTTPIISLFKSPPFSHHGLTLQGPTALSHSWVPPTNAMNPRCSKVFERP